MDRNQLSSAERARWLADLAAAIEDAQRVARNLGHSESGSSEAKELYAQLEAARVEVESLRRGHWPRKELDLPPNWLQSLLDSQRRQDPTD